MDNGYIQDNLLFDKLPNDIIMYMALNYDLASVLSFCRSSKRFNSVVCENDNFWMARLKQDFGLDKIPSERLGVSYGPIDLSINIPRQYTPKEYYEDLVKFFRKHTDINVAYRRAISLSNPDLVMASIRLGADISYDDPENYDLTPLATIIRNIVIYGRDNMIPILGYLLSNEYIDSEKAAVIEIQNFYKLFASATNLGIDMSKFYKYFYDYILPNTYKYSTGEKWKNFWKDAANKLEEMNNVSNVNIGDLFDLYNRRINELRELEK